MRRFRRGGNEEGMDRLLLRRPGDVGTLCLQSQRREEELSGRWILVVYAIRL